MKHIGIVKYMLIAISVIVVLIGGYASVNVDLMLRWMYIILGLAVACVVLLPLYTLAQNPKGAMGSLIGLVAILVVFGVAYALGSDTPVITPANTYDDPFQLKISDAGLYMTYFMLIASIVVIIYGEIRKIFK